MKRRLVLIAVVLIGLVWVAWASRSWLSLAALAQQEQSLRQLIANQPVMAWAVGWTIYFLASLVPATRGKAIVAGWLFGFWGGLVLVNVALTAAALVTFEASRWLLRDLVENRYGSRLVRINQALEREGAWYVLVLRLVPVSFSLTNYLLGATKVRTRTYWWATQLGLLPGNAIFVFVGARLPSLTQLAEDGIWAFFSYDLMLGLVLLSLFPLLVHALVRRWRSGRGGRFMTQSPGMPQ